MECVSILRVLVRRRLLVALGAVAAALLTAALYMQAPFLPARLTGGTETTSHAASTRLLLDARSEPTLDLNSAVAETLGLRAGLLADLLTTDTARAEVAKGIGIGADQLAIIGPAMGPPTLPVPLAVRASDASRTAKEPYVLTLATDLRIPIITLRASAPNEPAAVGLAHAARSVLEQIVASRPTRGEGLAVRRLGSIAAATRVHAPQRAIAIAVGLLAFIMWLVAIIVVSGLARQLRSAHRAAGRPAPI